MAIGNYYPIDLAISDNDLFLGTNGNRNNTVNYTAQAIADYLNTNAKVSIGGQLSFKFDTVPGVAKTISFNGGGGDNTPFSSITELVVSAIDLSGANVTVFLDYLKGTDILLAQQNQPNAFGHYTVTNEPNITVFPNEENYNGIVIQTGIPVVSLCDTSQFVSKLNTFVAQ